jgi:hypothetical protein
MAFFLRRVSVLVELFSRPQPHRCSLRLHFSQSRFYGIPLPIQPIIWYRLPSTPETRQAPCTAGVNCLSSSEEPASGSTPTWLNCEFMQTVPREAELKFHIPKIFCRVIKSGDGNKLFRLLLDKHSIFVLLL